MSCSNRHTQQEDGVWRLGQACAVGVMTDTEGEVTWHTRCLSCGVYSDPIPAKVASKWGTPQFDVSLMSRSILGFDQEIMAEGWYTWKITAAEPVAVKRGKNAGKPMYKMTFMVTEGSYVGRTIDKWVCLFDSAWWAYKDICKALDLEVDTDDPHPPSTFVGQVLRASVKWEPGFQDSGMVAALDNYRGVEQETALKGKVRIAI